MHLELHPTHPDLTGGIGFISEAQGRFVVFILAYGISNIAATVGYEIAVLNYDLAIMPVWGPLVGRWLAGERRAQPDEEIRELVELATLGQMFARIERIRIVPFDLRSFGQRAISPRSSTRSASSSVT